MKKILVSVSIIAAAAAVVIGATTAYFSDTETSTGNTFTAGTIDIDINGDNPFVKNFNIGDLKPGETGYMNFKIKNVGTNPVNVSKKLYGFTPTDSKPEGYLCTASISGGTHNDYNTSSEPECVAEKGTVVNNVQTQIIYDLSVEVYKNQNEKIWWQTIYSDGEGKHISDVYQGSNYVVLGMIPAGGYMLVTQSYHFDPNTGNEYQGDGLKFDMEIKGDQMAQTDGGYASVVLENKTLPDWNVVQGDDISGTLNYKTHGSKFEYAFSGKALLTSHGYVLAIGKKANGSGYDVDTQIATGSTNSDGNINLAGSIDINKDMTDVKVWLVPTENWSNGMVWTDWPSIVPNILWETGLISYDDTDL